MAIYAIIRRAREQRALAEATGTYASVSHSGKRRSVAQQRLPYALAIATGAVAGLWHSGQLQSFFGALS